MDYNKEYYIIGRKNIASAPLFDWAQLSFDFYKGTPVEIKEPIKLRLGSPKPKNPKKMDYHSLPKPVLSEKLKNLLETLKIKGIQLLPAKVEVTKDEYWDYWFLHIYNKFECIDTQKSSCLINKRERIISMDTIVLDNKKIEKIPLKDRLIFIPKEYGSYEIFHESIVEKIDSLEPTGLTWTNLLDWNDNINF